MPKKIRDLYEKGTDIDKRGVPVCGDYPAGLWGCSVADFCEKIKDLVILFGDYKIKV